MTTRNRTVKKKRRVRAVWERGYHGHVLWLGKEKLGKVTLLGGDGADPRGKYRWEGAGRVGFSDDLTKARSAVEFAVFTKATQRDLFE